MVGVLVLHPEISDSNYSPNKIHIVYVILLIVVTWRGVDEPTSETPFFIFKKKNNNKTAKQKNKKQPQKKKKKSTPDFASQLKSFTKSYDAQ